MMRLGETIKCCTFAVLVMGVFTTPVLAGSVTYRLLDHGRGALGPSYGLRLDQITPDGLGGDGPVFSMELGSVESGFAHVLLTYDSVAGTAEISGQVWRTDIGPGVVGGRDLWDVVYTLEQVEPYGNGFRAKGGNGTLAYTNNNVVEEEVVLTGKQGTGGVADGFAFVFGFDGHRLPGDNSSPVGRGWLVDPAAMDNDPATVPDGPYNDWLVRAEAIPSPSAALFGVPALVVMGARRRRRGA